MKKITSICLVLVMLNAFIGISNAATLNPSKVDAANKVEYISDREFFYSEKEGKYVIMFSFKDKDKNRIACPCTVSVRLVNAEGSEVYSSTRQLSMKNDFSTWTWNSALFSHRNGIYGTLRINPSEIKLSDSSKGVMYIRVFLDDYFTFEETEIKVTELPTVQPTLALPTLPKTITDGSYRAITITNITYSFKEFINDKFTLKIYMTGEMENGSYSLSQSSRIAWRLIDSDGYIANSGTWYTDSLTIGDKFKNKEFIILNVVLDAYTLELWNVN